MGDVELGRKKLKAEFDRGLSRSWMEWRWVND